MENDPYSPPKTTVFGRDRKERQYCAFQLPKTLAKTFGVLEGFW